MSNVGNLNAQLGIDIGMFGVGLSKSIGQVHDWTRETEKLFSSSAKNITASIEKEKNAWTSAMKDLRKSVQDFSGFDNRANSRDMLGWYSMERMNRTNNIAEQLRTRRISQLPTGMSQTTELSMSEANMAAMSGTGYTDEASRNLGLSRTLRSIGRGMAVGYGPMGRLAAMGIAVEDMSMATKGVGIFGAAIVVAHGFAANLGREIKQVREEATRLGLTYDELAQNRGMPKYSRFTEGAALSATAGSEGAKGIGAAIWGGAVSLLGGGGGVSALAEIARQEEDTALWLKKMSTEMEGAAKAAEEQAKAVEKTRSAEAAVAGSVAEQNLKSWREAKYGKQIVAEDEYRQHAIAGGRTPKDVEADIRLFRRRTAETDAMNEDRNSLDSVQSFIDRLNKDIASVGVDKFQAMRNEIKGLPFNEKTQEALRLVDQFERVSKLNDDIEKSKRIEEAVKTPRQRLFEEAADIQRLVATGQLDKSVAGRFLAANINKLSSGHGQAEGLAPSLEMGSAEAYNAMYRETLTDPQKQMQQTLLEMLGKMLGKNSLIEAIQEGLRDLEQAGID